MSDHSASTDSVVTSARGSCVDGGGNLFHTDVAVPSCVIDQPSFPHVIDNILAQAEGPLHDLPSDVQGVHRHPPPVPPPAPDEAPGRYAWGCFSLPEATRVETSHHVKPPSPLDIKSPRGHVRWLQRDLYSHREPQAGLTERRQELGFCKIIDFIGS